MGSKDRTKHCILNATLELCATASIERVTVKDICERAGVSRQTFYLRFEDKFAVAMWYLRSLLGDSFAKLGSEIGWRQAYLEEFVNIEESVRTHPHTLVNLFDSQDYNSVLLSAARTAVQDFTERYRARYGHEPDKLVAFQISTFARTASVVSTEWIKSGCVIPADEFVDYFVTLIPRNLYEALDA